MAKANSYEKRLNAVRSWRWRAKHRDFVRGLQFRVQDLEAMLKARDEVIAVMLAELQEYHRHERIRSLVAGLQKLPADDGEEPQN
jgi:hypothetical protein